MQIPGAHVCHQGDQRRVVADYPGWLGTHPHNAINRMVVSASDPAPESGDEAEAAAIPPPLPNLLCGLPAGRSA